MEFGLKLTDAVATALGGSGHDGKPRGEPFVFEAAIGGEEGVQLAQRV